MSLTLYLLRQGLTEQAAGVKRPAPAPLEQRYYEVRSSPLPWRLLEMRDGAIGAMPKLVGFPIVWDSMSEIIPSSSGPFREIVLASALIETLADGHCIYALADHEPGRILGQTRDGSLKLSVTDHGLRCEIAPSDTPWARATVEAVRRQQQRHMSFGFTCRSEYWETRTIDGEATKIRKLLRINLHEVSVVTHPAYTLTEVGVEDRAQEVRVTIDISGHVVLWDVLSDPTVDGAELPTYRKAEPHRRRVVRGARVDTAKCAILINHNPALKLGSIAEGNLALTEDDRGIRFVFTPDLRRPVHQDVIAALRAGQGRGMSPKWNTVGDVWRDGDAVPVRELMGMILTEISIILAPERPSWPQTTVRLCDWSLSACRARLDRLAAKWGMTHR